MTRDYPREINLKGGKNIFVLAHTFRGWLAAFHTPRPPSLLWGRVMVGWQSERSFLPPGGPEAEGIGSTKSKGLGQDTFLRVTPPVAYSMVSTSSRLYLSPSSLKVPFTRSGVLLWSPCHGNAQSNGAGNQDEPLQRWRVWARWFSPITFSSPKHWDFNERILNVKKRHIRCTL